jgi:hypothetical protein
VSARNLKIAGVVGLNAKGQGSFDDPQLDATLEIPLLTVQGQSVTGIKLQANVANHIANATLQSSAVNTSIQAKAKIGLTSDYQADATLDTQGIPLGPLIAAYAPQADGVTGQTEVHATLHGPLRNQKQLEAHLTIPVLKVAYGNTVELAATGTDTDLQFAGSFPASGDGPMALMLVGNVNMQLAQLFDPDIRSSGQLKLNIDSRGPAGGANIAGQISIVDANFASSDLPVGLEHGNGVLTLTRDRLSIGSFKGNIGGGTITAQGGVTQHAGSADSLPAGNERGRECEPAALWNDRYRGTGRIGASVRPVVHSGIRLVQLREPVWGRSRRPTFARPCAEHSTQRGSGFNQQREPDEQSAEPGGNGKSATARDSCGPGSVRARESQQWGHYSKWEPVCAERRNDPVCKPLGNAAGGERFPDDFNPAVQHQSSLSGAGGQDAHAVQL